MKRAFACVLAVEGLLVVYPSHEVERPRPLPPIEEDMVFQSKYGHIGRLGGTRE